MNNPDNDDPSILPMICMVDVKSRLWPAPVVHHGVEACKREIMHAAKFGKDINNRPPLFAEYPDDFDLVMVGRFDSRTGTIFPQHERICSVADVLKAMPKE